MTGRDDLSGVSGTSPRDEALRRLLAADAEPSLLSETLAALSAAPEPGPQPGEAQALAAFRELVAPSANVISLAHRRRLRAAALASSVVVVMGGGMAAAATGALPDSAQQVAKNVLGVVGVHVPGPAATPTPSPDGSTDETGSDPTPAGPVQPSTGPQGVRPTAPASHPAHPSHPAMPPTPGNSGPSRHHGNPTPTSTVHPTPGHGKPTAPPATSNRHVPRPHPTSPRALVTHGHPGAISS